MTSKLRAPTASSTVKPLTPLQKSLAKAGVGLPMGAGLLVLVATPFAFLGSAISFTTSDAFNPINEGTTTTIQNETLAQEQRTQLEKTLKTVYVLSAEKETAKKKGILVDRSNQQELAEYKRLVDGLQLSFSTTAARLVDIEAYTALSEQQVRMSIQAAAKEYPQLSVEDSVQSLYNKILLRDECGIDQACQKALATEQEEANGAGVAIVLLSLFPGLIVMLGGRHLALHGSNVVVRWREQLEEEKQALLQGNGEKDQLSLPAPQTPAAEPVSIPAPRRKITLDL